MSTYPPVVSGLSRYAEELCDFLNANESFIEAEKLSTDKRTVYKRATSQNIGECDLLVYNLGNHPMNIPAFEFALRFPSICVLHEYHIPSLAGGKFKTTVLKKKSPIEMLVDAGNVFIVHSSDNKKKLENAGAHAKLIREFFFSTSSGKPSKKESFFGVFGYISPSKGANEILKGYLNYKTRGGKTPLVFAGNTAEYNLKDALNKMNLRDTVTVIENPADSFYDSLMLSCSAAVNLRLKDSGETSANMLKLFSLGKVVAMNRIESIEDYFDNCFFEIDPLRSEEMLSDFFFAVDEKSANLAIISEKAKEIVTKYHSLEKIGLEWTALLKELIHRKSREALKNKRKTFIWTGKI
ncbi:MAG: hypothetical protein PHW02_04535 [bacterium]|nr:hypothetical protein [bacterium]